MKNSVWAIFGHMIADDSLPLHEQHRLCPRDSDTWCKFWKDRSNYNERNRLSSVFIQGRYFQT